MDEAMVRLDALAGAASPQEAWTIAAYVAGQEVVLDEAELQASVRRSLLLLAAGGDPRRELELDSRAVTALAADLDTPERRATLAAGLEALAAAAPPALGAAASRLLAKPDLAWHALAAALLAAELADDD